MALIQRKKKAARKDRGMTLIELMIALVILLVGLVGSMALVALSVGGNGRSRQQGNSTIISQLLTEQISNVKASNNPVLTLTDCAGNNFPNVQTTPGGSPLLASGDVDFNQAPVAGYQIIYTDCGTAGKQVTYDVRWNIQQPSPYTKLLIVSTQKQSAGNDLKYFSLPVTIRTLVGQGT